MMEIANDVYHELERTYIQVEGEIPFAKRVPEKTLETWRKQGIVPRGAMREIMELMHRTHMGVDQHYENITKQSSRTALGRRLGRVHGGHRNFRYPLRYPHTGDGRGEHGLS